MAKKSAPKIISKKHLARQEREARQTRLITWTAIGVVILVILGIAYGILSDTLLLRFRPAVTVNGESLSLQDFQVRVRATRQSLIGQYMQYMQFGQMLGVDPRTDPSMSQALDNITSELDSSTSIGSRVIDDMTNSLLIRQYANANGIKVTAEEVDKSIQDALGYFPNGTPTQTLTPTTIIFPTLNATQMAIVSPTATPTTGPTSTPRPTWTPNLTATKTLVPSVTPTATPYTQKGYEEQLSNLKKNYVPAGMSDAQFRVIYYEDALYRDKVEKKITADVKHEQEQVWARHILLATTDEAKARDIYNQLKAGADFATLAAQNSIDTTTKDKGGDLGWFGRGKQAPDFETSVWPMKIGVINEPFKSTYGYDIVQVLGHEVRPLTDTEYQDAVNNAFNDWLQTEKTNSKVAVNDNWTKYVPTTPTLAQAQQDQSATITSYIKTYSSQSTPTATK
jgi:parvulin-like peptidyl-prolyl isomerase